MGLNIMIMEVAIALIIISVIVHLMIRRKANSRFSLLWIFIALLALMQAIFPQIVDNICDLIGIGYPPTFIILAAIIVLLGVCMYISSEVTVAQNKIMELSIQLSMLNDEMYALRQRNEQEE